MANATVDQIIQELRNLKQLEDEINSLYSKYNPIKKKYGLSYKNPSSSFSMNNAYEITFIIKRLTTIQEDQLEAFRRYLSSDPELALAYFRYNNKWSTEREECDIAFDCLLKHPDLLGELFEMHQSFFKDEQRKLIFEMHGDYYPEKFKSSPNALYDFCCTFNEYISDEVKELLIKRMMGRKQTDRINNILNGYSDITLTREMKDQLEAYLVMNKMRNG